MPSTLQTFAFIGDVGGGEMILIFFVVLMLFGGQRLPELARGLGKSIREFKKATSGVENEIKRALEEEPVRTKPAIQTPVYTPPPAAAIEPSKPEISPAAEPPAQDKPSV